MNVNIGDNYTNDTEYRCEQCDSEGVCFTTEGDTQFCPNCGTRLGGW